MNIELREVTKSIGGVTILDRISYNFTGGYIYGLRGKNGCGKTMLMRALSGLMQPTSGEILIKDKLLYKDIEIPDSIGILIENPSFLPEYTGKQNLKLLSDLKKKCTDSELDEVLLNVGLEPKDNRKVRKYSLGMKQRLGIAAAIMGKPEIILLDEPINAIDEAGVASIRDLIRGLVSEDRVIIIACHDRDELDYMADKIINMENGKLIGEE